MKIKKIDDYQSWYIESEDTALIIDPWLDKVMQPKSNFFINRAREENALITDEMIDKIACILISAPFEDHFHETVPHEVAHYIVDQLFKPGPALKPHGVEWKKVMWKKLRGEK